MAKRVGTQVILSWTTPDKTTDGLPPKGTVTAVGCREMVGAAGAGDKCVEFGRVVVVPGASRMSDTLTGELLADPPAVLGYRVELFSAKWRSAKAPEEVYAASGAAPEDPGALRVTATKQGALVEWKREVPGGADTVVEVTRQLVGGPAAQNADAGRSAGAPTARKGKGARSVKDASVPVILRAGAGTGDRGGMIDVGVVTPNTYDYKAQRVRTVILKGHKLELWSGLSASVLFLDRDVFPPARPTGLESVAAAGSIDLSWEMNVEPDLLGYNVYRTGGDAGVWVRLNHEVVGGPAYRDLTAVAGTVYLYRVTALDRNQNESLPSSAVRELLKPQVQ